MQPRKNDLILIKTSKNPKLMKNNCRQTQRCEPSGFENVFLENETPEKLKRNHWPKFFEKTHSAEKKHQRSTH